MDKDLMISKIHTVFEGELIPGKSQNNGRHCDGFVYFNYGKADYSFDGYSFHADSKSFFYLAKDSAYKINTLEKVKYICINFDFIDNAPHKSCIFKNISPTAENEFSKMFHIWNKKSLWYNPQAFSILYALYCEAIKSENKKYVQQNYIFSKISSYVLDHYTEPELSVKDIADYIDLSETHLRRIFKNAVNTSPTKYISHLRLEKAKNMLISSNYTINNVARSVGFDDPYYFSRIFKKETGLSPSEYRSEHI